MKKELILLVMLMFSLTFISSECSLDVSLLNQDPYPATPGSYVKLVFQVTGTESPDCESISIELIEKYPISFDQGEPSLKEFKGGTFQRDYSSSLMVPYKVRLDEDALDGENRIEVLVSGDKFNSLYRSELFNIEVDDTRADFEVFIKEYNPKTRQITFEILNIAESDVEAVTLEIPSQDTIKITGAKTNIVGDIDSNEYTTADFLATPSEGDIKVMIYYSDAINERRVIEKTVYFNPNYFSLSVESQKTPWYIYLIIILIIAAVAWYFMRKRKKKKIHHKMHRRGRAQLG